MLEPSNHGLTDRSTAVVFSAFKGQFTTNLPVVLFINLDCFGVSCPFKIESRLKRYLSMHFVYSCKDENGVEI